MKAVIALACSKVTLDRPPDFKELVTLWNGVSRPRRPLRLYGKEGCKDTGLKTRHYNEDRVQE